MKRLFFIHESAHRRYLAKHARLLRFNDAALKASGAVAGEMQKMEGHTCQVWNIP